MTNFIQRTSGALSQQECDAVIDFFESNKERHFAGTSGAHPVHDPKRKIDTELRLHLRELIEDERLEPVAKALYNAWGEYTQKYPFLNKLSAVSKIYLLLSESVKETSESKKSRS